MKLLKTLIPALLTLFASLTIASCDSSDPEPIPEMPVPRTVFVYMIANNSLGQDTNYDPVDKRSYDKRDLAEMVEAARTGSLGNCRWIVYHHPYREQPMLIEITQNGADTIKVYSSELPSTSKARMSEAIADVKSIAPANDYGLILWSHASGWIQDGLSETDAKTSRSFGDDMWRRMNITTLRETVENEGFSFIYADCCNMASVEVAYELRNATRIFAGSVTELPGDGMPYNLTMKYFTANTPDIIGAARETFNDYNSRPAADGMWCTMSVINTAALDDLARETARVYKSSKIPEKYRPQSFDLSNRYYFDLKHLVDAMSPDDAEWNKALDDAVIYQAATQRFINLYIDTHCGLSTFIPNNKADLTYKNYNALEWYDKVAQYIPVM